MLRKILEKIESLIQLLTTVAELLNQLTVNTSNLQTIPSPGGLHPPRFLSIQEAASRYCFSTKTFRRWIQSGKIIPTTIGGRDYFEENALREYIVSNGFAKHKGCGCN
ncbi:helix-turn-helix domain-containing protein [Pedobacter hartonius]|uniref:Helix-turn-helix domain-containing protein n=1 Tax=Pedobacter hartonius TaxID=425514 RepID=A0A1H4BV16_9SPHI|nr:helix-turn-helix domain-containing protein [Pedobacter hartonius]SEA51923.1 Helix-turn-helix domain-containing protein [Pedobacter hartonius]